MTEEELIIEAKQRFPVGTVFQPAHIVGEGDDCIITEDTIFKFNNSDLYAYVDGDRPWMDPKEYPQYGNTAYNRMVYQGSPQENGLLLRVRM